MLALRPARLAAGRSIAAARRRTTTAPCSQFGGPAVAAAGRYGSCGGGDDGGGGGHAYTRPAGTLSHVSADGTRPKMVDVADKAVTKRVARASALVSLPRAIFEPHLRPVAAASLGGGGGGGGGGAQGRGDAPRPSLELVGKKGAVFSTAIIAGVLGAKNTSSMLPFCHPLPLESCDVDIDVVGGETGEGAARDDDRLLVSIRTSVSCTHKTGVEMEALTAASCAALCIYDMCKALSHDIVISDVRLVHKSGGKSDFGAGTCGAE